MPKGKSHMKGDAISLRQAGYSYELIREKTGVSKSTLSGWLKYIPYKPNNEVKERMRRGQLKSSETLRKLRIDRINLAKKIARNELGGISRRDLLLLGIGLYIGEGGKYERGCIQFSNSDPKVVKLAMEWFMRILNVGIDHFRPVMHLYPDNSERNALRFWSKCTGIPVSQFNKTYIDKRGNKSIKNKRKLPYGTIHIRIRSLGKKEFGASLYQKILGWIEFVEEDTFAGIV